MCNQGITLLLSLQTCPALALTFTLTLNLTRILILTVSGGISLPPTWHGNPAKVCQVSFPAVHLARKPRKSVPGVFSRLPPATAVHLITGCCGFSVGHMAVFSMKRAIISTPAAAEYMHLSENNDVPKKVQLQVSHVWTHLQYQNRLAGACRAHLSLRVCRVMLHLEMTTLCDFLIIRDFAVCAICRCATESRINVQ